MASQTASTSTAHPYQFPKAGERATRAAIADNKPLETASHSSAGVDDTHSKSTSTGKPTDNYERAAASAVQSGTGMGLSAVSGTDRPVLGRVQSWNKDDLKREQHASFLSGQPSGQGYTTTEK